MKLLSFFILVSAITTLAANSYSQQTKFNISFRSATVREVLQKIEDSSEFIFLYSEKSVDVDRKVDVNVTNQTVDVVLDQLFNGTRNFYEIRNRQISILEKGSTENSYLKIGTESSQQSKSISGKVTDSSGGSLPGVSVVIKGTTIGTITDTNGNYTLSNIPNDAAIIQFSFVGMKAQELKVAGKAIVNITLMEENIGIEEVVAVGYGSQKKASITGSVATINADKLTIAPVASTTNTLAGRLPGLIAKQESGLPGSDKASLSIRGFGTPLVIVDGVESSFNNIDANEIESVTVLKDASSAIYGARAGDGVILVITKRGSIDKPTITLNSTMTFQGPTNLPKLGSSGQIAELTNEEYLNLGKPEATIPFTQEKIDLLYAGTDPDYPNTNWLKLVARDWAPQQQHNLSVRGGSDKIKYYGFLGFLDQQSMFKKNGGDYNRYNLRSNIDAKILDNLSLQLDLSSIVENKDFPWRSDEKENSVWQDYWTTNPWYSPTLPDPSKLAYGGWFAMYTNSDIVGYKRTNSQNMKGTLSLNYDFNHIKGLSAKAFANYNQDYTFYKSFARTPESWTYNYSNGTYIQQTTASDPTLTHQDSRNRVLTGQFSLNFDRTFVDLPVKLTSSRRFILTSVRRSKLTTYFQP